jgi:glycosyltransferase involved in cell wall biosynthesis
MKEKNILFCINSMNIGGAEQLLVDKINNWNEIDNLHLVILIDRTDMLPKINRHIKIVKIISKNNFVKIKKLRDYLIDNKIDYCFSHLEKSNKISLIASILIKTQTIVVIHNINIYKKGSKKEKLASLIYKLLASKVVAISDAVLNYLSNELNLNSKNINLIENGIDFNRIKFDNSFNKFNQKRNFFCLGRLVEAKGYDFMLECLNDEYILRKDWEIIMIGDGVQKKELEFLIKKNNLTNKVSLIGKKINPFSFVKKGSLALMPSRREGLPIALLEILSQGIPVLSSDILPLEIISNNYNGLKFKSTIKEDFKRSFLEALEIDINKYEYLSINAKKSVASHDIKNCVNKYNDLIK